MSQLQYIFEFAQFVKHNNIEQTLGILGDYGKKSKFGEQTRYFKDLLNVANELGIDAYVFTNIDPKGVTAWKLENNLWVSEIRKFPKVFYNRSFKKRPKINNMSSTQYLTKLGSIPLNPAEFRKIALDKQLAYELLMANDVGDLKLPESERFNEKSLIPFVNKHNKIILKPRYGSGGKGIIKVSKNERGFELQYNDKVLNCVADQIFSKIEDIRNNLKTINRLYIMQEYITLPKYLDSVFDVRVIYQRDINGEAMRTGMATRLAAQNRVTANLHQGGGKEQLSTILKHLFNQDINGQIANNIREYSKKIFDIFDKQYGPIGEMGIDFLIDQNGDIYFIEVNSVPGRNLFKILPDIRETAIRRPIEYAKYLLNKIGS